MSLDDLAVVLTKDQAPGFYSLCFAVRVHDDRGVEVLGMATPRALPVDDIAALLQPSKDDQPEAPHV